MALILVIMLGLNMVQASKDVQRCKKENFQAKGCSVYKKLSMHKEAGDKK